MARLRGQRSFAHGALADRMAATPERALQMLMDLWPPVLAETRRQLEELQALAEADEPGLTLEPWDRLYYERRWREAQLGSAGDALAEYLALPALVQALFWSAQQGAGLSFEPLDVLGALPHPSAEAYEVRRGGDAVGVLVLDLFHRAGKGHGAHQQQWRAAERFQGRVLPISCISLNLAPPAAADAPVLLPWEYANVLFHEFGHALHMLCCRAPYPSLGSLNVPWDFIELPSLLHERWLARPELLQRFARHHESGAPLPPALLDGLRATLRRERIFSLQVDYLATAIVDLRMHLLADGRPGGADHDPIEIERATLAELGMPRACAPVMGMAQAMHCWSERYAAGLYVYLWGDLLAADAAECFEQAPGGWLDEAVARRWHDEVLSVGAGVDAAEAFRRFRGRDVDPGALLRRFGLA